MILLGYLANSIVGIQVHSPSKSLITPNARKDKRGIFGFLANWAGKPGGVPPPHPPPDYDWNPSGPWVPPSGPAPWLSGPAPPLGAHYHTTVTKKFGVPYPVPVKVSLIGFLEFLIRLYNSTSQCSRDIVFNQ